ncbi:MAG: YqgE/AlgH family protein [Bacteroidota bacterium]
MNHNLKPAQGRLLISEPALRDFYFSKSVVLLVEHEETEGSFGFIINKPVHLKLNEVVKDFPNVDFPLFLGGPVHPERLFYLHTMGEKIPGSLKVFGNLYWGGDIKKLMELIELNLVGPSQVKFFIGYSGWEAGQLSREMEEKSWIVTQGALKCVLANKPETLWGNILKKMGNDYAIWANFPSDPILN